MKHFWKKQVSAFLLALVMVIGLVPMASAKTAADIIYDVKAGGTVALSASDFEAYYNKSSTTSGSFRYVEFSPDTSYTPANGVISHVKGSSSTVFSRGELNRTAFYKRSGQYQIDNLVYEAGKDAASIQLDFRAYGSGGAKDYVDGAVEFCVNGQAAGHSTAKSDLTYQVEPGKTVVFDRRDFRDLFEDSGFSNLSYVEFSEVRGLDNNGTLWAYDHQDKETSVSERALRYAYFYYDSYSTELTEEDYYLADMSYTADSRTDGTVVTMSFTMHGERSKDQVEGTLSIEIGDVRHSDSRPVKGDINYTVAPGKAVSLNPDDFNDYFQQTELDDIRYVDFTASEGLTPSNGRLYFRYGSQREKEFTGAALPDYRFYYWDDADGDYDLYDLSFVAGKSFRGPVVLEFRAYSSKTVYVDGTLVIRSAEEDPETRPSDRPENSDSADIRYYVGPSGSLQINPNDIARFFNGKFPDSTLEYVRLDGIPSAGYLFYDYFNTSSYGEPQMQLEATNYGDQYFYFSPESRKDFALSDLSYVPRGVNYCASIPFTAYGSGRKSVSGNIFISVTLQPVSEVYGPTPKNAPVTFPATALGKAVSNATGTSMASIRLLALPDPSVGVITAGSGGVSLRADTTTRYGLSSGTWLISQLRFTPAKNYTGPVEIPYAAYDGKGNQFAAGKLCLGIVNKLRTFKDISSTTWCYRYVTELADAGIIDGYKDGTFQEKKPLTYGAALKLVMLAAGYPEQAPTVKGSVFSGYLDRAKKDGLVSGKIKLTDSITRLEVSRLAAKALKLDVRNLSSVKPFTDTNDPYVQALNAAGIVNGYFSDGTSTFKPDNSLTRGHISAIVWRMNQYRK